MNLKEVIIYYYLYLFFSPPAICMFVIHVSINGYLFTSYCFCIWGFFHIKNMYLITSLGELHF